MGKKIVDGRLRIAVLNFPIRFLFFGFY
jgi:hypothetical protein